MDQGVKKNVVKPFLRILALFLFSVACQMKSRKLAILGSGKKLNKKRKGGPKKEKGKPKSRKDIGSTGETSGHQASTPHEEEESPTSETSEELASNTPSSHISDQLSEHLSQLENNLPENENPPLSDNEQPDIHPELDLEEETILSSNPDEIELPIAPFRPHFEDDDWSVYRKANFYKNDQDEKRGYLYFNIYNKSDKPRSLAVHFKGIIKRDGKEGPRNLSKVLRKRSISYFNRKKIDSGEIDEGMLDNILKESVKPNRFTYWKERKYPDLNFGDFGWTLSSHFTTMYVKPHKRKHVLFEVVYKEKPLPSLPWVEQSAPPEVKPGKIEIKVLRDPYGGSGPFDQPLQNCVPEVGKIEYLLNELDGDEMV